MSLLLGIILISSVANAKTLTFRGHIINPDGQPVANHNVTILSDSIFGMKYFHYRVVKTLADGSYIDTANVPENIFQKLHFEVWTMDCKNAFFSKSFFYNGSPEYIADFKICDVVPDDCFADFVVYYDSLLKENIPARFFDKSQGNNINTWHWEFGDNTMPSKEKNPQHIYAKPGQYNVCLTVANIANGVVLCKNTICKLINLNSFPPQNLCKAAFVAFRDSTSLTYNFFDKSVGKEITKWHWDFGDSTYSDEKNPIHTFDKPGTYNICLKISSPEAAENPCKDQFCFMLFVKGPPPVNDCKANFNTVVGNSDLTLNFIDKSVGENISRWYWNFGDEKSSFEQNPSHKYDAPGTYKVCLTVFSDDSTCYNTFCGMIYVKGTLPPEKYCKAFFYVLKDSVKNTFNFIDKSLANNITSWAWDFGDEKTADIQNPSHTYANPGAYKVCLTITATADQSPVCTDSYCFTVFIDSMMPPPPPNNSCKNYFTFKIGEKTDSTFKVNFMAFTKSDVPLIYEWSFGDDTKVLMKENMISHIYPKKGNYHVCLTTYPKDDSLKCSFTSCETIFGIQDSVFAFGSLSGKIYADNNFADAGFVAIVKLNSSNSGNISYFDAVKISNNGSYKFNNVPEGDYYVLALLNHNSIYFKQYMPTFYGDVWRWQEVKMATIVAKTETADVDIHLKKMIPHKNGKCGFSGFVFDGFYKSAKNAPVSNVEVILYDNNDNPIQVTYTDNNGYYKFAELDYGTYKLAIEVTGMETIASVVTVDETSYMLNDINFSVDLTKSLPLAGALLVGDNSAQSANSYGLVYPNPVRNEATINIYTIKSAKISVAVYSHLGQLVSSNIISLSSGMQAITINTAGLSKGTYLIKISENNVSTATRRFVKLD